MASFQLFPSDRPGTRTAILLRSQARKIRTWCLAKGKYFGCKGLTSRNQVRTSGARITAQDPTAALRMTTAFRLAYGKAGGGRGGETGAGGSTISGRGGGGDCLLPQPPPRMRRTCSTPWLVRRRGACGKAAWALPPSRTRAKARQRMLLVVCDVNVKAGDERGERLARWLCLCLCLCDVNVKAGERRGRRRR